LFVSDPLWLQYTSGSSILSQSGPGCGLGCRSRYGSGSISRVLMTKKLDKITAKENYLVEIKNCSLLIPSLHIGHPIYIFSILWVFFALLNSDRELYSRCGSASESSRQKSMRFHANLDPVPDPKRWPYRIICVFKPVIRPIYLNVNNPLACRCCAWVVVYFLESISGN
jgi:hypothetical protein